MSKRRPLDKFRRAWKGLCIAFKHESSFRIQMASALFVLACLFALPLELWKQVTLFIVAVLVLVLELVNTSIERVLDLTKPRWQEEAGVVKDVMAGAVFLMALAAVCVGLVLLGPTIISMISRV